VSYTHFYDAGLLYDGGYLILFCIFDVMMGANKVMERSISLSLGNDGLLVDLAPDEV
jgi:hypothetical protein